MPSEPQSPPTISAADITSELARDGIPEGYICFKGYLQTGSGRTDRIIVDDRFVRWLEVDREDIVARSEPSQAGDLRNRIWVRRGARVAKCEVSTAPDAANEGWGVDTDPIAGPGIVPGVPDGRRGRRPAQPDLPARIPPPY